MKHLLDITCARCGMRSSTHGLDLATVRAVAAAHVCADGVRTPCGEPTERITFGSGERTKLPEERNRW